MSSVKSRDTQSEVLVRSKLHKRGFKFRKNLRRLPGSPDIVFVRTRFVVFIDGDFWHGRHLDRHIENKHFSGNRDFWISKLNKTISRDRTVNDQLLSAGRNVMRVWESDVKRNLDAVVDEIISVVNLLLAADLSTAKKFEMINHQR